MNLTDQCSLLEKSYEAHIKAAKTFITLFKQTIIDAMKICGLQKCDISNTFLKRLVNVTDDIIVELHLRNLILKNDDLLIEYENEIYENFDVLTSTEVNILYFLMYENKNINF